MPRFPYFKDKIFIKLISFDEKFKDREPLGHLMEDYAKKSKRTFLGYSGFRAMLSEIAFKDIPAVFVPEKSKGIHSFLFGEPRHSLTLHWEDPDFVEIASSSRRLTVMAGFENSELTYAKERFLHLIKLTRAFWGELNILEFTGKITFSGPSQHIYCLPKFGSMNYLGKDYLRFLGRANVINAGFDRTTRWSAGMVTEISASSPEEFFDKQDSLCQRLGGEKVFEKWEHEDTEILREKKHHVHRHLKDVPKMEITITSKGLTKKLLK